MDVLISQAAFGSRLAKPMRVRDAIKATGEAVKLLD
jgi:hypothetical protein